MAAARLEQQEGQPGTAVAALLGSCPTADKPMPTLKCFAGGNSRIVIPESSAL